MWVYLYQNNSELAMKNAYIWEYHEWQPWENLLAYYPLTNNSNDHKSDLWYSWTDYNLSVNWTTPSYWTYGATAVSACGLRNNSIPRSSSFTAMLWCKRTSSYIGTHWPIALTEKFLWLAYWNSSHPQIWSYSWGGDGFIQTGVTMQNDQWYHLWWVMNDNKITIYINGTPYWPYNYRIGSTYNWLVVMGTYYQSTDQAFIGTVWEVYLWDRNVTAQEIADYYDLTKRKYWIS